MKDIIFKPDEIGNVPDVYEAVRKKAGKSDIRIVKHFIDARHKNDVKVIYRIDEGDSDSEDLEALALPYLGRRFSCENRPVIVGFGPAGMFCALILARYGLNPIVIEKGKPVDQRSADVELYKEKGTINPSSNIQFGKISFLILILM